MANTEANIYFSIIARRNDMEKVNNSVQRLESRQAKMNELINKSVLLTSKIVTNDTKQESIKQRLLSSLGKIGDYNTKNVKDIQRINSFTSTVADSADRIANTETQIAEKTKDATNQMKKQADYTSNIASSLLAIVASYVSLKSLQSLVDLSDQMTLSEGKIAIYADPESGWSVEAIKQAIYNVAQDSRASYTDLLSQISKMAINTGGIGQVGSVFGDYESLMAFNDLLQKTFVIGGSGVREINATYYQLTQALSSGRLQGDEFRSIIENAPYFAQKVLDYVNAIANTKLNISDTENIELTLGQLRDLGAQGVVTADVLVNAMAYSADEINKNFNSIPMTWEQTMTKMKNSIINAIDPILNTIQDTVNSSSMTGTINSITTAVKSMTAIVGPVLAGMAFAISLVASQWQILLPIIAFVTASYLMNALAINANTKAEEKGYFMKKLAMLQKMKTIAVEGIETNLMTIKLLLTNAQYRSDVLSVMIIRLKNSALYKHILATKAYIVAGLASIATTYAEAGAIGVLTVAWDILTASMYANPLMWIIGIFVALVAILYWVADAMGLLSDTSMSIAGAIVGVFGAMYAVVYDIFAGIYNLTADIVNGVSSFFGMGNQMDRLEYKNPMDEYASWYKSVAGTNENNTNYEVTPNSESDEITALLTAISGNTEETADNTSTHFDILRDLSMGSYTNKFATNITIETNINANINSESDLDNIADGISDRLAQRIQGMPNGYYPS